MYGDKPLGALAVHEVDRQLRNANDLKGSVFLSAAVNLPAIESRTRINPDHLAMNRRFPGSEHGFLTDQFAHRIQEFLRSNVDCVVDLHSGTPGMALWYTYDFGNTELSASFGYLPVVVGHASEGQLGSHLADMGLGALLPEFGGGRLTSVTPGVEGALNVLRYRGHIGGIATGPKTVPLVSKRLLFLSSTFGALETQHTSGNVGHRIDAGRVAWITNVATGEVIEEFHTDAEALLLMTAVAPAMVGPGDFVSMLGFVDSQIEVPNA
jgi:predicted deacylase